MTPFARFFIFLIFFLPIAFFGIKYAQGEDPSQLMGKIKEKIVAIKDKISGSETTSSASDQNSSNQYDLLREKDEEIFRLQQELEACRKKK